MNGICRGARTVRTATKGATLTRNVKCVADGTKERKEGEKMSCSLWRWSPACDDELCVGDCDLCGFEPESEGEDDQDGSVDDA